MTMRLLEAKIDGVLCSGRICYRHQKIGKNIQEIENDKQEILWNLK